MLKHQVYRHYDKHGVLLYVGCSVCAISRLFSHHQQNRRWFYRIATVTLKHFASYEAAFRAEKKAIQKEKPLFNIRSNGAVAKRPKPKKPGPK